MAEYFVRKSQASPDVRTLNIFYMHDRWVKMNGQSDHRAHGLDDCADIISKLAARGLVVFGKVPVSYTHLTLPTPPYV